MHINGNTAAVIPDSNRFIGVNNDADLGTMAGKGFVDSVIRDLKNHMVQTRAVVGITDIHAGSFSYCVQAFQNLDAGGIVVRFAHSETPEGDIPAGWTH